MPSTYTMPEPQISLSTLQRVDGSCALETSEVNIISSVTGPIESRPRQELPRQVALEIVITPLVGASLTKERLLEDKLKKVLVKMINTYEYPRQLLQIVIQFLKTDLVPIKEMKYIINSSYLALIDSGVSLNGSWLATCCILTQDNTLKFDFSAKEYDQSSGSFLVVYDLKDGLCNDLILFESHGEDLNGEEWLDTVFEESKKDINKLNQHIRGVILSKVDADYVWK